MSLIVVEKIKRLLMEEPDAEADEQRTRNRGMILHGLKWFGLVLLKLYSVT